MGSNPDSGVILPSMKKLAAVYGLPYYRLRTNAETKRKMPEILAGQGPALIEVMTDPFEELGPKAASRQQPDGSWQDANGVSYIFFENGVQDSNGTQYYYDPPQTGVPGGVEVGEQADFYDTQGNHIVCTMDENGNWVDAEGNVYHFGVEGVTDYMGNFHPY